MLTDQHGNPISKQPTTKEKIGHGFKFGKASIVAIIGGLAFLAGSIGTIKNAFFPDKGQLDVAIAVTSRSGEGEDDFEYGRYSYKDIRDNNTVTIRKTGDFYDDYSTNRRIVGQACGINEMGFHITLPVIDFLIANNTEETQVISELLVNVMESSPDRSTPIYMISEQVRFATVTLVNQGWIPVEECELNFNLLDVPRIHYPHDKKIPWPGYRENYVHSLLVDSFSSLIEVNFSPILREVLDDFEYVKRAYGVSPHDDDSPGWIPGKDLERFARAIRPFKFSAGSTDPRYLGVTAVGQMTVRCREQEDYVVEFAAWIPLIRPSELGGGSGIIPSNECDIRFRDSDENYQIKTPLALWVEPKRPLRIPLILGGNRSGFHRFTFSLLGNGKTLYTSPTIDAEIAIPRAAAF